MLLLKDGELLINASRERPNLDRALICTEKKILDFDYLLATLMRPYLTWV